MSRPIEYLRSRKRELESRLTAVIAELLTDFQRETAVRIDEIEVELSDAKIRGTEKSVIPKVRVHLEEI
jgi:phenylpyruvate tautomerase PptA (4-oxalocrotonate tautomerase family)